MRDDTLEQILVGSAMALIALVLIVLLGILFVAVLLSHS